MITIRLEDLADVLTSERCPKVVGLEEFVLQVGWRCAQLVTLLPVAGTTGERGVVGGKHRPATLAAPTAAGHTITAGWPGRGHLISLRLTAGRADRGPAYSASRARRGVFAEVEPVTRRHAPSDMEHSDLGIDGLDRRERPYGATHGRQ